MSAAVKLHPSYLRLIRRFPLCPIRTRAQYDQAARVFDELAVRDDASLDSGEDDYLQTLALLIEEYDRKHFPMPIGRASPIEILKFLMQQNGMTVTGLGQLLSSKGTASDILHGKRQLSKAHIIKLAQRFKVEPGLFLAMD